MISIIDYGVGNIRSVQKAFEQAGADDVRIIHTLNDLATAEKIVLPGVGAIHPAMKRLHELSLVNPIKQAVAQGRLFLGICLGFQLLFENSSEFGQTECLGLIDGTIQRFPNSVKIPQMGWNNLTLKNSPLWNGLPKEPDVYFCHSFYAQPSDPSVITASTTYGIPYCSAVQKNNVFGVQFHPEKSQTIGLTILKNFVNLPVRRM